ncbi:MAG: DUF4321 domain-containing protein [Nitrospirae bacterium]|nr:MAG: DUF4321 domain-containing protein [Nitrospirota bacterium]
MLLIVISVGALLGHVLGEAIGTVVRHNSLFYKLFIEGINPGIKPPATLDLKLITLTLGFTLRLNMVSVIGVVISLLLFRRFF